MSRSNTDHMFPFEFLQRSESARKALEPLRIRIWEKRAWAFWQRGTKGYYTTNRVEAEVFDFSRAWEIATAFQCPNELMFDPVNDPITEPEEKFRSHWRTRLKQLQREREGGSRTARTESGR